MDGNISTILALLSVKWQVQDNGSLIPILPVEDCELLERQNRSSQVYLVLPYVCLMHAPNFTEAKAIKAGGLITMAVVSFFANVVTIVSILQNRKHRLSSVYRLILHLTIADLFVTLFCIFGDGVWTYMVQWLAGHVACKLFKFAQLFSVDLSTFILVLIGVDRFVAVRYPMKSLTAKYCNRFTAGAWILSAICSIPQLVIFRVLKGPFYEDFYQCVTHGFYTADWQEKLYGALNLLINFILPLFILISTYVSTVCTIARSERLFKAEVENGSTGGNYSASHTLSAAPDLNRRRLMQRAKSKSLRISVVIVVVFIIMWTPYYVLMIYFMFVLPYGTEDPQNNDHIELLKDIISGFGISNSLVNPLIYGAFHLWRPRQCTSSYRSVYCNRDGSTRRSSATHVSVRRCDSRGTQVVVAVTSPTRTNNNASNNVVGMPSAVNSDVTSSGHQKSAALTALDCGGEGQGVKTRLVARRVSSPTDETSAKQQHGEAGIILRYGDGVQRTKGHVRQTRI